MKTESQDNKPPIEIPAGTLSPEVLKALVESFVLREGTDYGRQEIETETKIAQILKQISKGHVRILFDPNTESVTLMTEHEWKKLQAKLSNSTRPSEAPAD